VSFWWNSLPDPKTPAEERVLDLVFKKFYVTVGFIEPELANRIRRAAAKWRKPRSWRAHGHRLSMSVFSAGGGTAEQDRLILEPNPSRARTVASI
jgi:hypothetical protein